MLQQTRAQTVIPYYQRFLEQFPSAAALAAAPEDAVLAAWSGLGYYSRARNLQRSARLIAAAGRFPEEFESIRELPGVGDYTAAAVASIAFGLPYAVLDGNVLRVVARVKDDAADIASSRTRARFRAVAQAWLDPADPGRFNQALMELGATVCLPRNPLCLACPLRTACAAAARGVQHELPVKLRRAEPVHIDSVLLVIRNRGRVLLRQRAEQERRMPGFWDLPSPADLPAARLGARLGEFRHTITHHLYRHTVFAAACANPKPDFLWLRPLELTNLPLSTTTRKALRIAGIPVA